MTKTSSAFQDNYVDEEGRETEEPEENHVNLIGSDNESDFFLTKEKHGFFSSNQTETNYEDSEDCQLGFENAIMEFHRQYDLRRKKNQETSKKNKTDTIVRNTPENIPKRIADSTITMAKKTDPNKDKTN